VFPFQTIPSGTLVEARHILSERTALCRQARAGHCYLLHHQNIYRLAVLSSASRNINKVAVPCKEGVSSVTTSLPGVLADDVAKCSIAGRSPFSGSIHKVKD